MDFSQIVCSAEVGDKLFAKHGIEFDEVEEVLASDPEFRRGPRGAYYALGQTLAGRYLFVVLRPLGDGGALIVTARDMDQAERRTYLRR